MNYINIGLTKISEEIKKDNSNLRKILIPLGVAAGIGGGSLLARKLLKPKWKTGQKESVVNNISDMIMKERNKNS